MAWSKTAPTLPSGSDWSGSVSISQIIRNHIKVNCDISIARLRGTSVAVKCHFTVYKGAYDDYYSAYLYLKEEDSSADTSIETPAGPVYSAGKTMDVYWTGNKDGGASVKITIGLKNDSSSLQSKTLTAPALLSYPVTYNGNGNTGGSTSNQSKIDGTALTLRQNGFTKTGYTFVKWNTKADGTGTSYNAGASYTTDAALTLYAIWQINSYTIDYNGNGSTSGSVSSQTKNYGSSVTVKSNGFSRTGYTFVKWNTKSDGTGTSYNPGDSYTANASVVLYAIWQINTYSIAYNGNGSTGGSTSNQTKNYDASVTIQQNGFIRTGYIFQYWNTSSDGTGTRYDPGDSYSNNSDLTLYAIWKKANIPVFVNVDGSIHQVEKAYTRVGNHIKECTVYTLVSGHIKILS